MNKKNIIIVGYPKSGTTWLSRLIAELVECPLQGDWGFDHIQALYKEGEERTSEFQCYKSHHTYQELSEVSKEKIYKIIYIVRDPRDIAISGMHYFNFSSKKQALLKKLKLSNSAKSFSNIPEEDKKKKMIHAVLYGDKNINQWLNMPWKDHLNNYKDEGVLLIKYEELIDNPQETCTDILKYLTLEKTTSHITNSIEKQSFKKRKREIEATDNPLLKKIIRKGGYGYWKEDFSKKENNLFIKHLIDTPYHV